MSSLFIVPTPIGNLEDITFRAIRILKEVDTILAEDTRNSGTLLKHFGIETKMTAYHQHNEHEMTERLVHQIKQGQSMAIISDSGTPGISDAAYLLVRESIKQQINVICLPGATAFLPALMVSGFPTNNFLFAGFLPQKKGRQTKLRELLNEDCTIILYESPNRLEKLLEELMVIFGETRRVSVSRELTKLFEETKRGTLPELLQFYKLKKVKGEIVVVIEGRKKNDDE
ncbi:MAG: 16S rRNA (cytidine(1402)-2'-O)-methyltransferase [Chitinophagales bacterium]|nr:16S rRNA (cytidine(1402)-2'-O)-methyltransferase [Chitinophagales bacterium]